MPPFLSNGDAVNNKIVKVNEVRMRNLNPSLVPVNFELTRLFRHVFK